MSDRTFALTVIMAWVVLCIVLAFAPAHGHDHNRPDLNEWFHGLHSKGHAWCCDGPGKDALHLSDADWETVKGHYRVKIPKTGEDFTKALHGEAVDTMWADVPEDAVIEEPNKDGATLVWPTYGYQGAMVRCFMPGSMT